MYSDRTFQEVINKYGVEGAWELIMREFQKRESLQQPSPNLYIPTIVTNKTVPPV